MGVQAQCHLFAMLSTLGLAAALCCRVSADTAAAGGGDGLPELLQITWHCGPDLPQGFQDSDGGVLHGALVTVGGFCSGQTGVAGKEERYPRGFLSRVWAVDLGEADARWRRLPDFPGAPRQELMGCVVGDALYCWGGFSYSAPFCYSDGYRLTKTDGQWVWSGLPSLPWPVSSAGVCAIGSRIYLTGGADYDLERFYTQADREGAVARMGARLLTIDTADLQSGWQELPPCPGTPRWVHATAAVDGKIYVIGGATGMDNSAATYCTVVDNWCYDTAKTAWDRLPDLPVSSGNFPAGAIAYADRYILLVGGYQYGQVMGVEGALRPAYGAGSKHYPDKPYYSDIFVFDTQTRSFGRASSLPLNNNLPMTVVSGDRIHLVGGETSGCRVEGESFGHHPDLYLVGSIQRAES